jgi:hypothetical protein
MRTYGSVRGAISDGRPYRDKWISGLARLRHFYCNPLPNRCPPQDFILPYSLRKLGSGVSVQDIRL